MKKEKARSVEQIIRQFFTDTAFGVEPLAGKAEVSVSYLREIIYQNYQMPPHDLIETIRLETAIEAMHRNHTPLQAISFACVFITTKLSNWP